MVICFVIILSGTLKAKHKKCYFSVFFFFCFFFIMVFRWFVSLSVLFRISDFVCVCVHCWFACCPNDIWMDINHTQALFPHSSHVLCNCLGMYWNVNSTSLGIVSELRLWPCSSLTTLYDVYLRWWHILALNLYWSLNIVTVIMEISSFSNISSCD